MEVSSSHTPNPKISFYRKSQNCEEFATHGAESVVVSDSLLPGVVVLPQKLLLVHRLHLLRNLRLEPGLWGLHGRIALGDRVPLRLVDIIDIQPPLKNQKLVKKLKKLKILKKN